VEECGGAGGVVVTGMHEASSTRDVRRIQTLGTYLKELDQRGRVDELAQEEHAPASGAEQADHRLAERSAHGLADEVELDDRDLGIRRLVKHDALVPRDATIRFPGAPRRAPGRRG